MCPWVDHSYCPVTIDCSDAAATVTVDDDGKVSGFDAVDFKDCDASKVPPVTIAAPDSGVRAEAKFIGYNGGTCQPCTSHCPAQQYLTNQCAGGASTPLENTAKCEACQTCPANK